MVGIPTIYGDEWGMVYYCYTHIINLWFHQTWLAGKSLNWMEVLMGKSPNLMVHFPARQAMVEYRRVKLEKSWDLWSMLWKCREVGESPLMISASKALSDFRRLLNSRAGLASEASSHLTCSECTNLLKRGSTKSTLVVVLVVSNAFSIFPWFGQHLRLI